MKNSVYFYPPQLPQSRSRLILALRDFLTRLQVQETIKVGIKTEEVEFAGTELPRTPEKWSRKLRDSPSSPDQVVRKQIQILSKKKVPRKYLKVWLFPFDELEDMSQAAWRNGLLLGKHDSSK